MLVQIKRYLDDSFNDDTDTNNNKLLSCIYYIASG